MSTLPDDLAAAGWSIYPNGIYLHGGMVSCCFDSLERNITAARELLAHRARIAQAEAERAAQLAAKKPKRARRAASPITPPPTVPAAPAWQRAAQLTLELTE